MLLLILVISFLTSVIDTYSGVRPRYVTISQVSSYEYQIQNCFLPPATHPQQILNQTCEGFKYYMFAAPECFVSSGNIWLEKLFQLQFINQPQYISPAAEELFCFSLNKEISAASDAGKLPDLYWNTTNPM